MEILQIEQTKSSPRIILNHITNIHEIVGESYPENGIEFYGSTIQWLEEYLTIFEGRAIFNIDMRYFNSSTSRILMDIFDMFSEFADDKKEIVVNWLYDSENASALEYGEDFLEDYGHLNFNLVEK